MCNVVMRCFLPKQFQSNVNRKLVGLLVDGGLKFATCDALTERLQFHYSEPDFVCQRFVAALF